MSDGTTELKVTKEAVLRAAEKCSDAKAVLEELFPDAFGEKWVEVTSGISVGYDSHGEHGFNIHVSHGNSCIFVTNGKDVLFLNKLGKEYKIEYNLSGKDPNGDPVMKLFKKA